MKFKHIFIFLINPYIELKHISGSASAVRWDKTFGRHIKKLLVEHWKQCQFSFGNIGGWVSSSNNNTINHFMALCSHFWGKWSILLILVLLLFFGSVILFFSVCMVVTVNLIYDCVGRCIVQVISCNLSCGEFPWSYSVRFDGRLFCFYLKHLYFLGGWGSGRLAYLVPSKLQCTELLFTHLEM